jgi:hypothetical protein
MELPGAAQETLQIEVQGYVMPQGALVQLRRVWLSSWLISLFSKKLTQKNSALKPHGSM